MHEKPEVDIVIATIGRHSLEQAIIAAQHQTYRQCRVVVIGDGPCPDAVNTYHRLSRPASALRPTIYRQTQRRLGGYGDYVKRWWIDHDEASPWVRFLDDDDWIPPNAIADMMRLRKPDTAVILCAMMMTLAGAHDTRSQGKWKLVTPELSPHHAASGQVLLRTAAARRTSFPRGNCPDSSLAIEAAEHGGVEICPLPLYWYCGHQGGKTSSEEAQMTSPYQVRWPFKPPRSFRKRLFSRIPRENFFHADGRVLKVYDQMLFRPLDQLARKRAWITRRAYFYDKAPPARKTVTHSAIAADADYIIRRGFVAEGAPYPPVPVRPDAPLICFVVTAYHFADKIGRCLRSLQSQRGDDWECLVSVDGNDIETADAARACVREDPRFRIVVRHAHLLAPGNVLACIQEVAENQVVAFLDADDYFSRPDLAEEMAALYADPDVEIVCGTGTAQIVGGDSAQGEKALRLRARIKEYERRLRSGGHAEDMARWRNTIENCHSQLRRLGHE